MRGLGPRIHALSARKFVDARNKSGHDKKTGTKALADWP
jgi:hypothetical protein